MNLILFEESELFHEEGSRRLLLTGERAKHLCEVLKVEIGDRLRVGKLNGGIGFGLVSNISSTGVTLEILELNSRPLPLMNELLLAMPRPRMFKRILQAIAMLGTRRVVIFPGLRTESSYFQSPVLKGHVIDREIRLGLEQAAQTLMPEVVIYRKWGEFLNNELKLPGMDAKAKLLFHPRAEKSLEYLGASHLNLFTQNIKLLIGPEGGFLDEEVAEFKKHDFVAVNVGERILKVEMAVSVLLGQVNLLNGMARLNRVIENG